MTARDRTVVMVVLALVALAAGWLLVVSPRRDTAAKLDSSIQAVQGQLATLQGQVAADQHARASFSADYVQLAQLGEAVPQDDNVPSLLVELQGAAKASGVDFRGLQVAGGGSPGPSAAAAARAPGAGASSAGGASATAGASATSGASAVATPPPPGVSASAGFGAEQFTFTFTGQFFSLSDFLGRLQDFVLANGSLVRVSGRLMTLNAISLGPSAHGFPEMSASVSATTYLLPTSQGLLDGATAAGPATAPAASAPASTTTAPAAKGSAPAATTTAPASSPSIGAAPSNTSGAPAAPAATISAGPALSGGSK